MTLNTTVTWRGKQYRVTGYAMHGVQLYILYISAQDNNSAYTLKGKQLKEVRL